MSTDGVIHQSSARRLLEGRRRRKENIPPRLSPEEAGDDGAGEGGEERKDETTGRRSEAKASTPSYSNLAPTTRHLRLPLFSLHHCHTQEAPRLQSVAPPERQKTTKATKGRGVRRSPPWRAERHAPRRIDPRFKERGRPGISSGPKPFTLDLDQSHSPNANTLA